MIEPIVPPTPEAPL